MKNEKRIKELKELRQWLIQDLRNTNRITEKIGETPHLLKIRNLYLDQLNEIKRELEKLE